MIVDPFNTVNMNRRRNRGAKGSSNLSPNAVQRIAGAQLFNSANTVTTVPISPASFTRALAIADLFQFYRFTKIKVIQMPVGLNTAVGTGYVIHAYAPGSEFDTPPTTAPQLIELPRYLYHGLGKTVDSILSLGKKDLLAHAQLPWFKTIVGTEDPQFEVQANLYNLNTAAGATVLSYIIEYEVEFQSPNLAAQSPLRKGVKLGECPPPCNTTDKGPDIVTLFGAKYVLLNEKN